MSPVLKCFCCLWVVSLRLVDFKTGEQKTKTENLTEKLKIEIKIHANPGLA